MEKLDLFVSEGSKYCHINPLCLTNGSNGQLDRRKILPRELRKFEVCTKCIGRTNSDMYFLLASMFTSRTGIDDLDGPRLLEWKNKMDVIIEEVHEAMNEVEVLYDIKDSDNGYEGAMASPREGFLVEELADIVISCFTCADAMGIDLRGAYRQKMSYNLMKTGDVIQDGKVQDDVVADKPDFREFILDLE